jgi:ABC-type molybdate transport system substrate-binding protein
MLVLTCGLLVATHAGVAGQPYGVTVTASKPAELSKARTYQWTEKLPALNKTANDLIVAAVDRELTRRGLTKVTSGRSDTIVSYASVTRTDVDLKSKPAQDGSLREFRVGSIVLDLRDGAARESLFRVRMDKPIETDAATLEATINSAIAEMFGKYPAPKP